MSKTVYEIVTKQITDALERGVVPWRRPWNLRMPENAVSHKPYRGMNSLLLSLAPFADHRWVTIHQARMLGGYVRPGENSSIAIFWKQWNPEGESVEDGVAARTIPLLRFYHVFNLEQCDEVKVPPLTVGGVPSKEARIEAAEQVVAAMPIQPKLSPRATAAWYRPKDDLVGMPPFESFTSAEAYYATLFHELGHATGHESRLNRSAIMSVVKYGSDDYSQEELIAELTSAFCCASLGLDNSEIEQSASYIDGWVAALKGNPKAIVSAASQAQRAADFIRGVTLSEA